MKKIIFIFSILAIAKINSNAQSAVAIFKPLYSGDEHYFRISSVGSQSEAERKALDGLATTVSQKVGSGANGSRFIYTSTSRKGAFAVGRGKDKYGHYWHYEAVLAYNGESAARQAVLSRMSGRGLYDTEILDSGVDN